MPTAHKTAPADVRVWREAELPAEFHAAAIYRVMNEDPDGEYRRRIAELKAWMRQTATYYYGRPRERFFEHEARALASAAGCSHLILEDMS